MHNNSNINEIGNNIYWIGVNDELAGLHCNPYMIIDSDEVILIDPGSVLDFEFVFENIKKLISIEKIKYIILGHQDPDFCSAIPLLEKAGVKATIVTHWRTSTIVQFYGIKSPYYHVNEHDHKLVLSSGRTLYFIPTPYLHFPGAIATYDKKSKILFSSDLFGAFSYNWSLYADDNYIEKMLVFHEHYMPSNDIIRPVMEKFLLMDISMIAPQHGSIINNNIKDHIIALREIECGTLLNPIKREINNAGGYASVCNQVLKRYCAIFHPEEILKIFEMTDIKINSDNYTLEDYNLTGEKLWDNMFEIIYLKKGISWISVLEPFVRKLSKEYDISVPHIFKSQIANFEKEVEAVNEEITHLKELNQQLELNVLQIKDKLTKCPITGLYNELFFENYCQKEIEVYNAMLKKNSFAIVFISIDNFSKISFNYGASTGNETLLDLTYLINEIKEDYHMLFKMHGSLFAMYLPSTNKQESILVGEKIRVAVEKSSIFIEKMTLSIGIVGIEDVSNNLQSLERLYSELYMIAEMRLKIAKSRGRNNVCSESSAEYYFEDIGKILIIDSDKFNLDMLKTVFEYQKYSVIATYDTEEALELVETQNPDLIITELFFPKMDGFAFIEKLSLSSDTKRIPLIIMSHQKSEENVKRVFELNVEYYFQKPFILSEMISIVQKNIVKGDNKYDFSN